MGVKEGGMHSSAHVCMCGRVGDDFCRQSHSRVRTADTSSVKQCIATHTGTPTRSIYTAHVRVGLMEHAL